MTIKQIIAIAAIVINSIVPMTMKAATIEIDGVTWTYSVNNSEKKTVTLGGGSAESLAMAANTKLDAANIPWTFILDGETYTVTAIAAYAFMVIIIFSIIIKTVFFDIINIKLN